MAYLAITTNVNDTVMQALREVDDAITFSTSPSGIVYGTATARFIMPGYDNRYFTVRPEDPDAILYSIQFRYLPQTDVRYSNYFYNPAQDENMPRTAVFPIRDVVGVSGGGRIPDAESRQ
jgi:hypothetical protein